MDVLLLAPPKHSYWGLAQYPPVGLGYLATAARNRGYGLRILDCVKEKFSLDDFAEFLRKNKFDVIGITVWSLALEEVGRSLEIIKRLTPETVTVIGGPHPSALPQKSLEYFQDADFAFRGEAEIGFPQFLDRINQGRQDFAGVPGLIWRQDDKIIANPPQWEEDLDSLGFPSWDLINPKGYFMPGALISKDTAVLTCTRGCPYHCSFCSAWITAGRKIRKRSVKNILSEIEYLHKNYGIRIFDIPDENFTFDKNYVREFCSALLPFKKSFEFFLPNGIRLDSLDRELLDLMLRAGFRREVAVGIESGSERVLKLMRKSLSLEIVREKVALLNSIGFRPIGYFILGFPGETWEDMEKTVRFALDLKLYAAAFTPFAPMPGTEATNQIMQNGELPEDFDYTAIAPDKVAYAPVGIGKEELDKFRKKALLRFNLRWRPILYYLHDPNSFKLALTKIYNLFIKGNQISK